MIQTIIVDDEILSRIGIQSFIDGKEDIEVKGVFASAEEAIIFLRENPVDIVITDIEMSEMNGLEFIGHIRQENLADGIIILSCYENFSYAQEAIARGTDSYLLKHSITEETLIKEIKKVYQNCCEREERSGNRKKSSVTAGDILEDGVYTIGIIRSRNSGEIQIGEQTDNVMFLHLLEGIVEKNKMGTVFAPYNKEIFIVFRQSKEMNEEERFEALNQQLKLLYSSIRKYISDSFIFGISSSYTDLKQTREKYGEAVNALGRSFYMEENVIYYYRPVEEKTTAFYVDSRTFLQPEWMQLFETELEQYLEMARIQNIQPDKLKTRLRDSLQRILLEAMNQYGFSDSEDGVQEKFRLDSTAIRKTFTMSELKEIVKKQITEIRDKMRDACEQDELAEVFRYIDDHIQEKITIEDVTGISYMSVSTFCKKFKDRTGMTLVQYLNEHRIEKAKIYLRSSEYSLGEVSELTGFANTNYLVRVFKKITGQTVSEYRKKFGIMTESDRNIQDME